MKKAIVVGGGIVGAACADALTKKNFKVQVLEPNRIGGGATAAGMGHIVVMSDTPENLDLTLRGRELWTTLSRDLPPAAGFRVCGSLWVADGLEDVTAMDKMESALSSRGVNYERISQETLQRRQLFLKPGLRGGIVVAEDGVVNASFVAGYLLSDPAITVSSDRAVGHLPTGVVTKSGLLEADVVVNACGYYALDLIPDLPMRARKGHLALTVPCDLDIQRQTLEIGYTRSASRDEEVSIAFNLQPRAGARILIGASRLYDVDTADVEPDILARMLRHAHEFVPALATIPIEKTWSGVRAATPDKLPLVGWWRPIPGLILATGHEGLGIATALATAEIVADIATGGPGNPKLNPNRFVNPR